MNCSAVAPKYPRPGLACKGLLHLATLGNDDVGDRPIIGVGPGVFNHLNDVHTLDDVAKHDVLVVQVRCGHGGDKELATVCVGTRVGHAQQARLIMFELEVFVFETAQSPNGGRASTIAIDEVAALEHEGFDLRLFPVNQRAFGST